MTTPKTRKQVTYDAKTRVAVTYRVGQTVYDREAHDYGIIEAIIDDGALLNDSYSTRWFSCWDEIRPDETAKWL